MLNTQIWSELDPTRTVTQRVTVYSDCTGSVMTEINLGEIRIIPQGAHGTRPAVQFVSCGTNSPTNLVYILEPSFTVLS